MKRGKGIIFLSFLTKIKYFLDLENGIQQKSIRYLIDTFEPKYYFISCSTLDGDNESKTGRYSDFVTVYCKCK